MSNNSSRQHIVLLPVMLEGHVKPLMALTGHLAKRSEFCTVTLLVNPAVSEKLKPVLPWESKQVRLAELPFPSTEFSLSTIMASEAVRPAFRDFISTLCAEVGRDSVCVITDFLAAWSVEVADDLGVPVYAFMSSGAYGSAVGFAIWLHLPHLGTDLEEFWVPEFPRPLKWSRSQLPDVLINPEANDAFAQYLRKQFSACLLSHGFLFNTVEGLENVGMEYFERKSGRPVWAVGPVLSTNYKEAADQGRPEGVDHHQYEYCLKWLNLNSPSSVLYIAFGTLDTISASQMKELAHGLEASGGPFIWVVKPPVGYQKTGEGFEPEWLPEGFEDRMERRKQGILVKNWAPQRAILCHESTGAFLSHCGWNSTLESLAQGVPIIAWPLGAEQFFSAKMLVEEAKVSVQIAGGNSSEIDAAHVAAVIETVMGASEKGEEMRRNARRIREMMDAALKTGESGFEGSSVRALDDFLLSAFSSVKLP